MSGNDDFQAYKESLTAAACGPFFEDWEFSTLFGFDRTEIESFAQSLRPSTPLVGEVARAIQVSMANLLGYPHKQDAVWSQWISANPEELRLIFGRLQDSRSET